MDATLVTILALLALATVIALVQARKRDKCLKDFDGFRVTLAEQGGDLSWGRATVYTTGLEIAYVEPVVAKQGHVERSFIFYKDQYEAIDALYRFPEGLAPEAQARRREVIRATANPSVWRRLGRKLRNWISMIRDALVQAVTMVIGVAKSRAPGSAVLSTQEPQLKALSSEIIGHAGNAFDPLLEEHLYRQVVLEVTTNGVTRSYCGWLKDYTTQFIEVVDAYGNDARKTIPVGAYAPGSTALPGVAISVEAGRIRIANEGANMLFVEHVGAEGWGRPIECVLPPGYTADLTLPEGTEANAVEVRIGSVERVDMVVPRTHALVRHAADGTEARHAHLRQGVVAEVKARQRTAPAATNGTIAREAVSEPARQS